MAQIVAGNLGDPAFVIHDQDRLQVASPSSVRAPGDAIHRVPTGSRSKRRPKIRMGPDSTHAVHPDTSRAATDRPTRTRGTAGSRTRRTAEESLPPRADASRT